MYYTKFTITDTNTKEQRIKESPLFDTIEKAKEIMENYIMKTKNYIDIEMVENNKVLVVKNGGEILIEILEK